MNRKNDGLWLLLLLLVVLLLLSSSSELLTSSSFRDPNCIQLELTSAPSPPTLLRKSHSYAVPKYYKVTLGLQER